MRVYLPVGRRSSVRMGFVTFLILAPVFGMIWMMYTLARLTVKLVLFLATRRAMKMTHRYTYQNGSRTRVSR